jgi:L-seryl-tRNA(Ser) seleniumtransferase
VEEAIIQRLDALEAPSLRRVINATGVVLHTNLGRAPLSEGAVRSIAEVASGYSNLEYDLGSGKRGKRDVHTGGLLEKLLGAPAIIVNNNAAAILLVLNEIVGDGEVIVSRGELIEIGDGFRIPDIMARSGAKLIEVGTTNRTRIADYKNALSDRTRLLLRVHPSNFRVVGFTARPGLEELVALGAESGLPVVEDLGSGCLYDFAQQGFEDEPPVVESLRAGADLVTFSGDKLLGGPQAGIIAGKPEWVRRVRRNPLFRALRVDKLTYAALEATLRDYLFERYDRIPVLRMIRASTEEIRRRAEGFLGELSLGENASAALEPGESVLGGGSTPAQSIPTTLIRIRAGNGRSVARIEASLRQGDPAVIARIEDDCLLIDLRTVQPEDELGLAKALQSGFATTDG